MRGILILFILCLFFGSCQEGSFFEKNIVIPNQSWDYEFKPTFTIDVKDPTAHYDLFLELRHTAYYPYSNIFVLVHQKHLPQDSTNRFELKLAELDGRWVGKSAGNLYEQSTLIKENIQFPDTGKFVISLEQNMRDNPLKGVNDVGIKLIKK